MIPVLLQDIKPDPALENFVRKIQVFRFIFEKGVEPPVKFHLPRPEHSITFYPRDTQTFAFTGSSCKETYPACVINGIHTLPLYRFGGNDFLAIKVVLQPAALYQLLRFPIEQLTNTFINAEDIWGNDIKVVCEQLNELNDLPIIVQVIEGFLRSRINMLSFKNSEPIDKIPSFILYSNQHAPVHWLASQACLSPRQFIRKFEQRVGIHAKKFERIIRFDKALRMKLRSPGTDWLTIAIHTGYNDYQHLVRDFKEFTMQTPPKMFEIESRSPERTFGLLYSS